MTTQALAMCSNITYPHVQVNSTSVNVGASVSITCDTGYLRVGGAPVVTCLGSGIWSDKIPACIEDPNYDDGSMRHKQTIIISITAVGCAVAVAVLVCACYMLICHRKRKAVRDEQDGKSTDDDKSCVSEPFAVRQDCVGMPAVVFTNLNPTLTGKQSNTDEDGADVAPHQTTKKTNPQEKNFCY